MQAVLLVDIHPCIRVKRLPTTYNIHISERSRPVMTAINDFVMFNFRIIIPVDILITNSCTSV